MKLSFSEAGLYKACGIVLAWMAVWRGWVDGDFAGGAFFAGMAAYAKACEIGARISNAPPLEIGAELRERP